MVTEILKLSREPERRLPHIQTKLLQGLGVNMHVRRHSHPNQHVNTTGIYIRNTNLCSLSNPMRREPYSLGVKGAEMNLYRVSFPRRANRLVYLFICSPCVSGALTTRLTQPHSPATDLHAGESSKHTTVIPSLFKMEAEGQRK